MAIVADRSGNNPGNPIINGWTGTDKHSIGIKELQLDYYAQGGISTYVQGIMPLTSGLAIMAYIGADTATNITKGTLPMSVIPLLDPSKIPVINSAVQVIHADTTLTTLNTTEQNTIVQGAVVTLTDGTRWLYTGTGLKTLSTSYIQLADITPDWTVVQNKPLTFAPIVATTVGFITTGTTGVVGTSANAAREDHQHVYPYANINSQVGTTYTLGFSDHGQLIELNNAAAIALTLPNNLPVGFNCSICQVGAGQVTLTPGSGATMHNSSSATKTRAQWSEVSIRIRTNAGNVAAEYVVSGDMV